MRPSDDDAASRLPAAVRAFFATEAAGGVVLLAAAVVAVVWANSPLGDRYDALWDGVVSVRLGPLSVVEDLRHWVNDALMAVFFFVVGLEIKRELVDGELRTWRRAAAPAIAAVGGMAVPALVFLAWNAGHPGGHGWGVPMATDIAFALGIAALLGDRLPAGAKLFLLTLAIVDDIGAIVVIAVFYSSDVDAVPLLVAAGILAVMTALRMLRVRFLLVYALLAVGVWFAVYRSGVHATIAGVVLGLLAPARPDGAGGRSMTEGLERALHPFTSFVVVPVFALANAGVVLDGGALDGPGAARVAFGVAMALVVGKLVGVTLGTYAAVRGRVGVLPPAMTGRHVVGIAALAGIGFTVSLFVTDLAFDAAPLRAASKVGILGGSVAASVLGALVLWRAPRAR
jgi:NhaA family Na+:H+ antiporter